MEHKNNELTPKGNNFSDSLITNNLDGLSQETREALAKLAAEKRIDLEAKVLDDNLTHRNADLDTDRYLNTISDAARNVSSKKISTAKIDVNTTTGHMHMETRSSNCYVATATYQNKYHPNVVILRDYRDRFLRKSFSGKVFIYIYYTIGKYLAILPETFPCIRKLSKKLLDKIVYHIANKYYFK